MKASEHSEQCRVINWAWIYQERCAALAMLHAIPNAGKRSIGAGRWLVEEGMKSGVPDLDLPVPMGKFYGLVIEMKFDRNKTSENQDWWLERYAHYGRKAVVCYSSDEAIKVICEYLNLPLADYT